MNEIEKIISTPTPLLPLFSSIFEEKKVQVFIKCDYLTHSEVSGNKWRKLKYTLQSLQKKQHIVTFGGAYSNHIYAVAAASFYGKFEAHAFIRGEELNETSSKTLQFASKMGMRLHFVSRSAYRNKETLLENFTENCLVIPEGGSNLLALKGVSEMMDEVLSVVSPDYFCLAVGTGGTTAGVLSSRFKGKVVGFPVLKNAFFLKEEIEKFGVSTQNLELMFDYPFGGYGKWTSVLTQFIKDFEEKYSIPLDPIYTGKLLFGVFDLLEKDYFQPNTTLVIYHSGGLQGKP
jgi:1-aminocyclopropane-1-carboxylate deaminase